MLQARKLFNLDVEQTVRLCVANSFNLSSVAEPPGAELEGRRYSSGRKTKIFRLFTFHSKLLRWSFHVVVVHRTAKKCVKKENTESLFC